MAGENFDPEGSSRRRVLKGLASTGAAFSLGAVPGTANEGVETGESGPSVLVVKDQNPWGTTANEDVLDDLGASYDVVGSAGLPGIDLATYSTVVVPSSQPDGYYGTLADATPTDGGDCGTTTETHQFEGELDHGSEERHSLAVDPSACRVELSVDGPDGSDVDLYVTLDGRDADLREYDVSSREREAGGAVTLDGDDLDTDTELGILVHAYAGGGEYRLAVEQSLEGSGVFDEFVSRGGRLVAHVSNAGGSGLPDQFLPGDVAVRSTRTDEVSVVAPSHPLVSGVDEVGLADELSAEASLASLPDDATVVVEGDGDPTAIEYGHGDGTVVATGLAVERPWSGFAGGTAGRVDAPEYDTDATTAYLRNEMGRAVATVSSSVTTLSLFPGGDETPPNGHPQSSALPSIGGTAIDAWFYGDMTTKLADDLDSDHHYDKEVPNFPDEQFRRYRFKNTLEVSFATDEEGSIVPGSVTVGDPDVESPSYVTLVDEGKARLTRPWIQDRVFDGAGKKRPAVLQDPHVDSEIVEIDGVEAVRASKVLGAYDPYVEDMLDWVLDNDATWLFHILGVGSVERVARFVAATPSIYTCIELALTADGARLGRVWDASRFPRHAAYLDGEKRATNAFEKGEHWEEDEDWNGRFGQWTEEAQSQVFSPYGSTALGYADQYDRGYGPHPVMVFGEDADGNALSDSEVLDLLPGDPLVPL